MMNLTVLVYCDKCSGELEVVECKSYPASIRVKPCPKCLARAKDEGSERAYEDGIKAGYDEGLAVGHQEGRAEAFLEMRGAHSRGAEILASPIKREARKDGIESEREQKKAS